jgi:hypothetical protein
MRYVYFLPLALALLLLALPMQAQRIAPTVLATAGGFAEGRAVSLSWTLGQIASETRTYHGGSVTEGFNQPFLSVMAVRETRIPLTMSLYPNPARQTLLVNLRGADDDVTLILYNMLGDPVATQVLRKGDSMLRMPVSQLADGLYLLTAWSLRGERLAVYKVIKAE